MPDRYSDTDLLCELEPVAERLLDRHLAMAKDWLPHEYIPWRLVLSSLDPVDEGAPSRAR